MPGLLDGLMNDPAKLGLLQAGIGILANNRGHYGRAGPAVGAGLQQGLQGLLYAQAMKKEEDKKRGMEQWFTQMPRARTEQYQAPNAAANVQNGWQSAEGDNYAPPQDLARTIQPTKDDQIAWLLRGAQHNPAFGNKAIDLAFSSQKVPKPDQMMLNGKPTMAYWDEAQGQYVPVDGEVRPYSEKLDPTVQDAELRNTLRREHSLAPVKIQIARAGRSNNTIINKEESEEGKAVGKYFGEQFADIQKAGFNADSRINRMNRLNQLLEGVQTGRFTPLGKDIASAAASLGFQIDPNLGNLEAAESLSNQMALEMRNPAGGAGMPGAMSDQDRAFLAGMVPGLSKTPQGRKLMAETSNKLAQRDKDVARLAREYRKKHGTIDEGFYDELNDYAQKHPLFPAQPQPSGSADGWSIKPRGR